jgi:hypothetical protein
MILDILPNYSLVFIYNSLWKGTLPHPLLTQGLLNSLQVLPSLPLKVLRAQVRSIITLWIILVTIITGQRLPKSPLEPCHRTPAIPDRRLDIERGAFIDQYPVSAVFIGLLGEDVQPHEIWAWESQVSQVELA